MMIIINKDELKSMEGVLKQISVEVVKMQESFGVISNKVAMDCIEHLESLSEYNPEQIQKVNETYKEILNINITDDFYALWIKPEFVIDSLELFNGLTVKFIEIFKDLYQKTKFMIKPILNSYCSKWVNK